MEVHAEAQASVLRMAPQANADRTDHRPASALRAASSAMARREAESLVVDLRREVNQKTAPPVVRRVVPEGLVARVVLAVAVESRPSQARAYRLTKSIS